VFPVASSLRSHAAAVALGLLALLCLARPARAGDQYIVYAGVNGGADFLPRSTAGGIFGAQASASKLEFDPFRSSRSPLLAWGAFVDAAYITNRDAGRFSLGPQISFLTGTPLIAGLQSGFLTVTDHGRTLFGFSVAPALSIISVAGFFWLYGRWDHEVSNDGRENSFQVGGLAQMPVFVL
jgi:hypothetical protein